MKETESGRLRTRTRRISALLEKRYGSPKREMGDPLDTLVQTILSQNTNDRNRDLAYRRLKSRFRYWEDLLYAKRRSVVSTIRPAGLAQQKANCILGVLRWLKKREGRCDLSFLKRMSSAEIGSIFDGLRGIGPKTLHCLLLFGLGRETFPVDTHILRVGKRIGLIPATLDAAKAHAWMGPLVPKRKSLSLHLNLIRFGREVCRARTPQCGNCFLTKECPVFAERRAQTNTTNDNEFHE